LNRSKNTFRSKASTASSRTLVIGRPVVVASDARLSRVSSLTRIVVLMAVIVTSNKPFSRWGEVVGDPVAAATMIDRLVHHAEVVSLEGDSYRLEDRDLERMPTDGTP